MRIYSEKTKKEYKTVEACLKDEKNFDLEQAAKEKEKAELAQKRKERAREVEEAFKKIEVAQKVYIDLRNAFIKDYGSFHMTFSNTVNDLSDVFDNFFSMF